MLSSNDALWNVSLQSGDPYIDSSAKKKKKNTKKLKRGSSKVSFGWSGIISHDSNMVLGLLSFWACTYSLSDPKCIRICWCVSHII